MILVYQVPIFGTKFSAVVACPLTRQRTGTRRGRVFLQGPIGHAPPVAAAFLAVTVASLPLRTSQDCGGNLCEGAGRMNCDEARGGGRPFNVAGLEHKDSCLGLINYEQALNYKQQINQRKRHKIPLQIYCLHKITYHWYYEKSSPRFRYSTH
jgi:hypothetical protein